VAVGLIETYLSTVHAMWPGGPEPRLRRSRGPWAPVRDSGGGTDLAFFVLPGPASPRMLVPADNPAAAAHAMRRFSAGLSWADTLRRVAVSAALRSGAGFAFPHRVEVADHAGSLRDWLGDVLGEPVDLSIALGTARANRKPVLQVFDARGRSLAFVKVGDTALAETHVAAEVEALTVLARTGSPAGLEVPHLVHAGRWEGSLVLVMTALSTSVWQLPSRQWTVPVAAMAALHRHHADGTSPLTRMPLWRTLAAAPDQLPPSAARDRLGAALESLAVLAADRELAVGAWHGDWTPWNMARRRGVLQLWDWERFETGVPAGLDRCHYGVNAVCRRDGASVQAVLSGLRLAGVDPAAGTGDDRLVAAAYLAAIAGRYLVGARSELGATIEARSRVMLDSLHHVLAGTSP
jgi:hypothetical protein